MNQKFESNEEFKEQTVMAGSFEFCITPILISYKQQQKIQIKTLAQSTDKEKVKEKVD